MHPQFAAKALGVDLDGLTEGRVGIAFAGAVAACHPDNGNDPAQAASQIEMAKLARDVLRAHVAAVASGLPSGMRVCPACKGRGTVNSGGFKPWPCPKCKGDGHVPF